MELSLILLFLISVDCQLEDEINEILREIQSSVTLKQNPNLEPLDGATTTEIFDTKINEKFSLDLSPVTSNITKCEFECVPFYQCNNGTINNFGETIIDVRVNDGPCGNAFLTCCQLNHIISENSTTTSKPPSIPKGCGYRNSEGVSFKITGNKDNEAQFAEFPWVVSITRVNDSTNQRPSCGGALIHPQAVITAAHCVADKNARWIVRAGEWDILKEIEPIPYQDGIVESVTIHKDYYSGALFNDIAFLYLKSALTLAENVFTICLPPQNYEHKPNKCISTGWGKDKFGHSGKYHDILKKIDLPFVPRDICQENLRKTRLGKFFTLHSSFMCAGGEKGKDACNGDGGSPLVCPLEGEKLRYYQAGIIAWGIGCGGENIPGVYVDVAKFRDWIDEQMNSRNLITASYDQNNNLN